MKKSCPGKKGHPPTRDNLGGGGGGHTNSQANFSPYKHFGSPSQVDSVKVRQSEHAQPLLARTYRGHLFSRINAR